MSLQSRLNLKARIAQIQEIILLRNLGRISDYGDSNELKEFKNEINREEIAMVQAELAKEEKADASEAIQSEPIRWRGKNVELATLLGFLFVNRWLEGDDLENFFRSTAHHFVRIDKKTGTPQTLESHSLRKAFDDVSVKGKTERFPFECLREVKNVQENSAEKETV